MSDPVATAQATASMPAGPAWLTIPLGCALLLTLIVAVRAPRPARRDPAASGRLAISGGLLFVAGLVSWPAVGAVALTDILLYAASQAWIVAFWASRGRHGGEDDGRGPSDGGDGGGGPDDDGPSWWPDFERQFRDYARRGRSPQSPRDRLPA